jgi:hypothetical protein
MKYPKWVPSTLVELHKLRTEGDQSARKIKTRDPETVIADIEKRNGIKFTEADAELMRRKIYRQSMLPGLPDQESTALLEMLIKDQNMKAVWVSLTKRSTPERDPLQFFYACERGITGWRGHQKQTTLERREYYQEIYDIAGRLEFLMLEASAFDRYSIDEIVSERSMEWLNKILRNSFSSTATASEKDHNIRFILSEVVPMIDEVLHDIKQKAGKYRDETTTVKKPNAENAKVHYFARLVSDYCQQTYSQPLHEVVALTTSVIFDLPNCDDDYVRKIVKI